jgi:DNA-binding NtrC family response regulator
MPTILIADDQATFLHVLGQQLRTKGYEVVTTTRGAEAVDLIYRQSFDVVITDLRIDEIDGLKILAAVRDCSESTEVLVMTAHADIDIAVEAIKGGAYDFVTKPFDFEKLELLLERAIERRHLIEERHNLREQLKNLESSWGIVGNSQKMQEIKKLVRKLAQIDATVLITGESGTGKELVARNLHEMSRRSGHAFVAINCSAIPEELLESELFGHVRGAFTGATSTKRGLIEEAHRGTLFLDEVGEIPPSMQVKLLRFLEESTIRPVGSTEERRIDVRVLAATNRDLEAGIVTGGFREDLYYRLNIIPIHLPPLRARKEDIPLLLQHFLQQCNRRLGKDIRYVSREAMQLLERHEWPGNVRELGNTLERAVVFASGEAIDAQDLPPKLLQAPARPDGLLLPASCSLAEVERRYIEYVHDECGRNATLTAQRLKIGRTTLWRRLKEYGLVETAPGEALPAGERASGAAQAAQAPSS